MAKVKFSQNNNTMKDYSLNSIVHIQLYTVMWIWK